MRDEESLLKRFFAELRIKQKLNARGSFCLTYHTPVWYNVSMNKLTEKQKKVLAFIKERVRQNLPPTVREIASHMGFRSTGTVRDYLAALEKKGCLKRGGTMSRNIELNENVFKIPILGRIPAGNPDLAYEEIEGYVDAEDLFLGRISQDDVFALRIKGDSMVDAGIMDGDVAVIKKQPHATNGDIIAALLADNETTLKRLRQHNRKNFLEAANKNYPPIFEEFSIIGKLITIIRKYS
jgi:repressor LexA